MYVCKIVKQDSGAPPLMPVDDSGISKVIIRFARSSEMWLKFMGPNSPVNFAHEWSAIFASPTGNPIWSTSSPPSILGEMSRLEWDSQSNLLLVQLIYKYGDPFDPSSSSTDNDNNNTAVTSRVFDQIAQQLTTHTLIRPSKRKFTGSVHLHLHLSLT